MTIKEILEKDVQSRKDKYMASGIDIVEIDGNPFTDYKAFSFLWEKSYLKEPERSASGAITNLNSYVTFVTPHLKIDFSLLSIDSYRELMTLLYEKNEHIVKCYDVITGKPTTNKMYFATEEMPKLWTIARQLNGEEWVELLGVEDYTVELIGTNADIDTYQLGYHLNIPEEVLTEWEHKFYGHRINIDVAKNTSVIIGEQANYELIENTNEGDKLTKINVKGITFGNKYIFNGWNTKEDGSGLWYINEDAYFIMGDTTLYAQWKKTV